MYNIDTFETTSSTSTRDTGDVNMMTEKLRSVGKVFRLPGELYSYEQMNNGNINKSYRVSYMTENGKVKS